MDMEKELAGYPRQIAPHLSLRRILGEGGTSVVFEAFHTRLKVPVAVKVLAVSGSVAEQARMRLRREAELYALLDDPRIPRVYDVDELPDGTPYVVMEFVPGGSLESLLMRGPLSPHRAVMITREVLAALVYVHGRGVLHRDVKPANVILNEVGDKCQVRLVDFGIAKSAFDDGSEEALTQQGTLVGTPHYMAPERLLGRESDASGDTYAVGVMLYEMLSGVTPFNGPTLGEVIAAVLRDDAKPLHQLTPKISPELERVVAKAMSREPHQRYATAAEMLAAMTQVEAALQGDVSSPRIVPPSRPLSSYPPPTLEVMPDDLSPRRRRAQHHKPLLAAAAFGLALWAAWPSEVRDLRVNKEPELGRSQGAQPAAVVQEQVVPEQHAAVEPTAQAALDGTASQPAAAAGAVEPAVPMQLGAEVPPAAPLAPTTIGSDSAAAAQVGSEATAEDPAAAAVAPAVQPPTEEVDAAAEAKPTPRGRAARAADDARARRQRARPQSAGTSYEPVRSVPLQPMLERLDTLLKEPVQLPEQPKAEQSANDPLLPDNPY